MTNFGLLVIKPDAIEEGLTEDIIADVVYMGGKVVLQKLFQFRPDHIPRILLPIEFLKVRPLMVYGYIQNYIGGESMIAIFQFPDGVDGSQKILELKGSIDKGGIRRKYFPYSQAEMDRVEMLESPGSPNDIQLGLMKARNRVHSPDNDDEIREMMEIVLNSEEKAYMSSQGFDLKCDANSEIKLR